MNHPQLVAHEGEMASDLAKRLTQALEIAVRSSGLELTEAADRILGTDQRARGLQRVSDPTDRGAIASVQAVAQQFELMGNVVEKDVDQRDDLVGSNVLDEVIKRGGIDEILSHQPTFKRASRLYLLGEQGTR